MAASEKTVGQRTGKFKAMLDKRTRGVGSQEVNGPGLLAALLVLLFHVFHVYVGHWRPYPHHPELGLITEGHTGVSLFFVLSGFIFMTIALHAKSIDYRGFLRNRLLRIFPLFLVFYFVAISIGRDEFRPADILYLFFSNLGQAPTSNSFITGAAWTISVEFTFYLIFPFLARFTLEQGMGYLLRLLLLLAVIKLAAFHVSTRPMHMFYSTLVGRLDQFVIGMLAACLAVHYSRFFRCYGKWILPAGTTAIVVAVSFQARYASYFLPDQKQMAWIGWGMVEATLWASVVIGYVSAAPRVPQVLGRLAEAAGTWSYSLYLWHGLVIFILHRHVGMISVSDSLIWNFTFNLLLVVPVAVALAALSYRTIEEPFLRLRRRYVDQNNETTAAQSGEQPVRNPMH